MVRNQGRVTRFVVMAMLQAARAERLGLTRESAYSWGLNRAIFYAAAKRGFKTGEPGEGGGDKKPPGHIYHLGEDEAFLDPDAKELRFTIGGETQTPERFEQQVIARFVTKGNFHKAWEEAQQVVARFDGATLGSPHRFYAEVYHPRRDELSDRWTKAYNPAPPSRRGTRVEPGSGA